MDQTPLLHRQFTNHQNKTIGVMATAVESGINMGNGRWKNKITLAIVPFIAYWLMRIWFGTVRVQILDREIYDEYFTGQQHMDNTVAGSWHRHAVFFFFFFRKLKNRVIMVSRSYDGDITSAIARRLGYSCVRGSSSKGGHNALQAMIDYMNQGRGEKRFCGTAVDGPRGPARVLKKGMLVAAKESDAYFIPMACSGTNVFTFPKSWDKTILPKPFSKMVIAFGQPFKIPWDISEMDLEVLRQKAEKVLNEITDKVDQVCGYTGVPVLSGAK
jgi:lysophospholipid acyltransferase (LPLAT)-like uncharacterized protein